MKQSSSLLLAFSFVVFFVLASTNGNALAIGHTKDSSIITCTVATWNVGHFSKGKKPYSMIDSSTFRQTANAFQSVLFDSINADVICFNEFSEKFGIDENGQDKMTEDIIEKNYGNKLIGPLLGYSCNCVFSKLKISNTKRCEFEINKMVGGKMPRANKYYYVECDLWLEDVRVKLICAHTINSATALCHSQIAELIVKYRNVERVIMCGDWNTTDFSLFANSGYSLANDGTQITFPGTKKSIDNIVARGVKISNVRVVKTGVSDHYPLICRISMNV